MDEAAKLQTVIHLGIDGNGAQALPCEALSP